MKRILSVILAFAIIISFVPVLPMTAQAATSGRYTYTVTNEEATITDCNTDVKGKLTIPSSLGGYKVTAIGDEAFSMCQNLTGVTIPDGITSIGANAFFYCSEMTSVTIPNSVTQIGDGAFNYCFKLTGVTIPNGVTSINDHTFACCDALTGITIPNSVTSIGSSAFFSCDSLTSITVPNSVTKIGDYAFSNCPKLSKVTIRESVTEICNGAFYACRSLTSITIPESVVSIGEKAFEACSGLTGITLPEGVVSLGDYAFSSCSGLTSVTLPASLDSIGVGVFDQCTKLKRLQLSANNEKYSIDSKGVLFNKDGTKLLCALLRNISGTYSVPNSVTGIADRAFDACNSLTGISVPASVVSIGDYAFDDCQTLADIWVDEDNPVFSSDSCGVLFNKDKTILIQAPNRLTGSYSIPETVKSIGNSAFSDCSRLTGVTIPNGVITIGHSVFYSCSGLTGVVIPNSVTAIGNYAFYYCYGLTSIEMSDRLESVGSYTFYGCDGLNYNSYGNAQYLGNSTNPYVILMATPSTSVTSCNIHQDTRVIYSKALTYCKALTGITIPDSVVSIGTGAFEECTALSNIRVSENNARYSSVEGALFNKDKTILIRVPPAGISSTYTVPESVSQIAEYAFKRCSKLNSITIPSGVQTVDRYAFEYCIGLAHVWYSGSEKDRENISIDTGNKALLDATWHYNCCDPDSHVYDNDCDPVCNTCGYERTVADHIYTNNCDTDCNECGDIRSTTHTYDNNCDAVCNICGYERTVAEHIYTNRCDTTCNECGAERSITHTYDYICDDTCNVCGYKRGTSHIYDDADDVTCNACKQTLAPEAPAVVSVTDTTVTLVAVDGYEYSMNGTTWQKSNVFAGLQPFSSYKFYQRVAASVDNLASPAGSPVSVQTKKYTPATPAAPVFESKTDTTVSLVAVDGYEYRMDGTKWQTSPVFSGLSPETTYTVYQRIAETKTGFASASSRPLTVTTYSKLGTITYDPNGGKDAPESTVGKISTQRPTRSGYQFIGWALTPDTYAVYEPGDSYSHQEDIVLYADWEKLCDNCGGDGEYFRKCSRCSGTGAGSTVRCSPCGGKGYVYTKVTCPGGDCLNGKIIISSTQIINCPICNGDGIWEEPSECSNCYGAGSLTYICSDCSGQGGWWSTCSQCVSGIQKFTPEAPQAPKAQSVSSNTVVLVAYSTCQYSINGSNWQDSNVFSNLDGNTQYAFYQRYKATTYTNHSSASAALRVTTGKESPSPPQPPVLQSKTFNKVILEEVVGCEYSIDGINWQSEGVFADLLPLTSYTFYCRFAETDTHLCSDVSDGLTVVTEESPWYTVTFVNWDGTVLSTGTYRWGEAVTAPADPTKEPDDTYTYVFKSWDKEVTACRGDAVYTAVFVRQYIPGDLDGNDTVNEDDAIYLLRHVLMPGSFPVEQHVDFDRNGAVNEDDAIYLLRHVLMPENFPL